MYALAKHIYVLVVSYLVHFFPMIILYTLYHVLRDILLLTHESSSSAKRI